MHIPDGILSGTVTAAGFAAAGTVLALTSRKGGELWKEVPKISVVTAMLFVASLIHIPMGFTSVHFSFLGLAGILLGRRAFLAVTVAVLFQAILFRHGGLASLGVNIFNLGIAALVGYYVFSTGLLLPARFAGKALELLAVTAGMGAAVSKVLLGALILVWGGLPWQGAITIFLVHLPIILGEGLACGLVVAALVRFNKGVLAGSGKGQSSNSLSLGSLSGLSVRAAARLGPPHGDYGTCAGRTPGAL